MADLIQYIAIWDQRIYEYVSTGPPVWTPPPGATLTHRRGVETHRGPQWLTEVLPGWPNASDL